MQGYYFTFISNKFVKQTKSYLATSINDVVSFLHIFNEYTDRYN